MVRRESRATDAGGGREWMLAQILDIASSGCVNSPSSVAGLVSAAP